MIGITAADNGFHLNSVWPSVMLNTNPMKYYGMTHSHPSDISLDKLAKDKGFKTEDEMILQFSGTFGQPLKQPPTLTGDDEWFPISMWYSKDHHDLTYEHHDMVPPGYVFNCDDLADIWLEHWMKTPKDINPFTNPAATRTVRETYSEMDTNSLTLASDKADVYLVSASAFQEPDFRRVLIHRKASVLIPVYFAIASTALFPSLKEKKDLISEIEDDLKGVKVLKASLDGEKFYGCTVVRTEPLRIRNIPKNNIFDIPQERLEDGDSMEVYHGGFWGLTRPLGPGDHLLYFQAESRNYEMEVKMLITVLA